MNLLAPSGVSTVFASQPVSTSLQQASLAPEISFARECNLVDQSPVARSEVAGKTQAAQVAPGSGLDDAKWPIAAEWDEKEVDSSGNVSTSHYVLRTKLAPVSTAPRAAAAVTYCTWVSDDTVTKTNTIGGISQKMKISYHRWRFWTGGTWFNAYQIWETRLWWTRNSGNKFVGRTSISWRIPGFTCDDEYEVDETSAGFLPEWQSSTRTWDYVYTHTASYPIRAPGTQFKQIINATAPFINAGQQFATGFTEQVMPGG